MILWRLLLRVAGRQLREMAARSDDEMTVLQDDIDLARRELARLDDAQLLMQERDLDRCRLYRAVRRQR
jgi:hypothetical protein